MTANDLPIVAFFKHLLDPFHHLEYVDTDNLAV